MPRRLSKLNDYIVVSFYTERYKEVVQDLIRSLTLFELPFDVEPRKSVGSWVGNLNQKQVFILEKLQQYERPIVWLDADAEVKRYPVLFDFIEEDIGVFYLGKWLQSSTIFFNNNDTVIEIVREWIEKGKESDIMDQNHLQDIINKRYLENKMTLFNLPASYCYMANIIRRGKPVIYQTQASRKLKKEVNKNGIN